MVVLSVFVICIISLISYWIYLRLHMKRTVGEIRLLADECERLNKPPHDIS